MGVYIGGPTTVDDYSAMQGPAPDGFHVPLTTERQAVYDIWTALGGGSSDGTNFGIALKLPLAGYRYRSSADVMNQGARGGCWSSSRGDTSRAYGLYFYSNTLYPQNNDYRAYAYSVRCFKDTPAVPTSSWTKLYGTSIEAGGIFWSSTDGLISLSSDGQTRITIQDKNLGATTVWNSGDTLSEANCGKYYQRGNNYGFPRTGSVTTSSTQVNASNYGPGNYYSSSTFIKYAGRWDSTDNGNLWGGVTGVQPKTIYPELKNAYIGEYIPNFATQGPCPDGFHIPLSSEWNSLYTMGVSLGAWTSSGGNNFKSYIKLPINGYRVRTDGSVSDRNSYGKYWSADRYSSDNAYYLSISSSEISPQSNFSRATGANIRGFKNKRVIPDNSWTVLYQGAGGAGIYHNSTLGLISVSSDGDSWITISDKNLGATAVYNSGDTLSEANCGKYYQRGNNYGFPFSGSVSTSGTQVNASSYGPGNYYSSSTFIVRTSSPYRWDSTDNENLRGGTDGNIPVS